MNRDSKEAQDRMTALAAELNGESERAAAIVGAAWVEEALQAAIEAVMHRHDEAREKLFAGIGGLTTFEAKIELACLFGFMTDRVRKDLHTIRRLRNEFAHHIAEKKTQAKLSFSSESIKDRCLALNCIAHLKLTDPREAFTRACATLNFDFDNIAFMSSKIPDCGRVFAERIEDPRAEHIAASKSP